MPFILALTQRKLTRIHAFLERAVNKAKPYLTFPLHMLHDRLVHQGQTSFSSEHE